jgi:hypothetical protein
MKTLKHVATEMALHVLAYNIKRVISLVGAPELIKAILAFLAWLSAPKIVYRPQEPRFHAI